MPIYEYECQSCQKITETRQSITEAPLTTCTRCGGELCKIISQSTFQLKGGGWYADGYASTGDNGKSCAAAGECASSSAPACSTSCG